MIKRLLITTSILFLTTLSYADSATGTYTANSGNWGTPTNAYADGSGSAYLTQASRTWTHSYYGTSTSLVPTGATIDGVEIKADIWHLAGCADWGNMGFKITDDGGSTWSAQKTSGTPTTTETTYTMGSPSDVWGRTLTDTVINSTDFRVQIYAIACVVAGEHVYRKPQPTDPQGEWLQPHEPHGGMTVIEDIIVGDEIKGYRDGEIVWAEVLEVVKSTMPEYYSIKIHKPDEIYQSGLLLTGQHPIYVNGEYKKVEELEVGDELMFHDLTATSLVYIPVHTIERIDEEVNVVS